VRLSERWGQAVVVDPRPGGTGMIAGEHVAKSAPDGYTLFLSASSEMALNVAAFAKMPYDPVKHFAPITHISISPPVMVAHPSFPVKTVKELIAIARQRPGQVAYASPGLGSPQHFAGELIKLETKTDMVHVPYKGAGPAIIDLLGGHVPVGMTAINVTLPHITAGKLRGIAVTSARRVEVLPDLPTVGDTLPGFDIGQWFALWAPAGTPPEIIQKLNAETVAIVQSPQYRALMREVGTEVVGSSPEALRKLQEADIAKYVRIAREANIKAN
jgi:tripartite-type tricarboxylate transporter receptor subunit TctC